MATTPPNVGEADAALTPDQQLHNDRLRLNAKLLTHEERFNMLFDIIVLRSTIVLRHNNREITALFSQLMEKVYVLQSDVFKYMYAWRIMFGPPDPQSGEFTDASCDAIKKWITSTESIVDKQLAVYERAVLYDQYLTTLKISVDQYRTNFWISFSAIVISIVGIIIAVLEYRK